MAVIVAPDSTEAKGCWWKTPHINHKYLFRRLHKERGGVFLLRSALDDPAVRCVDHCGALNDHGKRHLYDNRYVTYPRCHWARRCVLCNTWYSLEEDASPTDWPHNWVEDTLRFTWAGTSESAGPDRPILFCSDCGAFWDMRAEDDEEPVKKKLL